MTLATYSIAWMAGIALGAFGWGEYWILAPFIGGGLFKGLLLAGRWREGVAAGSIAAVFLLGLIAYEVKGAGSFESDAAQLNGSEAVRLRGVVIEEPEQRDTTQRLKLRVESRLSGDSWQQSNGGVLVTARLFPRFHYGDEVEFFGKLTTPERYEGFDYREYLARQDIQSLALYPELQRTGTGGGNPAMGALAKLRRSMGASLERSMPEPESALARGILLGERAAIPRDLTEDFNDAGISHLVAISGYNVTLVAGAIVGVLCLVMGRRPATLVAMFAVVLFAFFVGASPSVLRAAAMGLVLLGASLAGRPNSARGAVFLAGAVLTGWDPAIIRDVSFQLSFAATVGIVQLADPFRRFLLRYLSGPGGALAETTAVTLAASFAAQPIILLHFERFSWIALPANLLTVASFPVILGGSFLSALVGLVSTGAGRLLGELTYLPLAYLIAIGHFASSIQGAPVSIAGFSEAEAVGILVIFLGLGFLATRLIPKLPVDPAPAPRWRLSRGLSAALVVTLVAGFLWQDALSASPRELTVTILDVGQGDAILIQTPAGQRVLIDGGPSGNTLLQALGRAMPPSVHRIDLMVLTHGQDDHITGLIGVVDRYDVTEAMTTPLQTTSGAYREWRDAIERRQVPLREAKAGQWIDLGEGIRLEVLAPRQPPLTGTGDDVNNNSVVLRLVYGEVSFLLTGDLAAAGETALLTHGGSLRSTVLKLGHHGSDTSSTQAFLDAVRPQFAAVSVGGENTYGHPSPTTRLRLGTTPLARTDQHGDVRMQTDGRRLSVFLQRGTPPTPR